MTFEVNSVKNVAQTSGTSNIQAQGETAFGNIPVGQNGDKYKQQTALKAFTEAIANGDVSYVQPNFISKLTKGDENHYVILINDANMKLSDVKTKFNLSEEAIYNGGNVIDGYGGGNYGNLKVPTGADGNQYIKINAKDLSTATGISEENLKAMLQT